ncbi:MAG: right-handed parallel beta-helix repeat-containing protein [Planctomycetota bacterium]|jgi:hypothetical protein
MKFAVVLFACVLVPAAGFSDTIFVPDDYSGIQEAIDAALNGDTVIVSAGTYFENIDFLGKAITVKSEDGPDVTVIDGGNPVDPDFASVVIFQNGEGPDSVLDGFFLTNGSGTWRPTGYHDGGGIFCLTSSPTVINNKICSNIVTGGGGGVCSKDGAPELIGNVISGNSAFWAGGIYTRNTSPFLDSDAVISNNVVSDNFSSTYGGGIYCFNSSCDMMDNTISSNISISGAGGIYCHSYSGSIRGNEISENSGGHGGGIHGTESSPTVMDNLVLDNTATKEGGGMIFVTLSSPIIENNVVKGNTAELFGGGIEFHDNCTPVLLNNIVTGNSVSAVNGGGGGMLFSTNSSGVVTNNTVSENTADCGGGIYCFASSPVITNSILWNNTALFGPEIYPVTSSYPDVTYCDVRGGWTGTGNIDVDPLFEDPVGGDFHLTCASPCIDAGDNTAPSLPAKDFDHDPRTFPGNGKGGFVGAQPQGFTVDMGADEYCCMKRSMFVAK